MGCKTNEKWNKKTASEEYLGMEETYQGSAEEGTKQKYRGIRREKVKLNMDGAGPQKMKIS